MLISAAPRTVHVRAADGSLPLHVAVLYSRPIVLPVIKYLLLLHPEAAILPDGHGLLPKELVSDNLVDLPTQLEIIGILESTASRTNLFMLPDFPHDDRVHQRISHTPASSTVNRKDANSEPGYSDDNSPKIKQCVVCMDHDASRLMVPCGHAGKINKRYIIFLQFLFALTYSNRFVLRSAMQTMLYRGKSVQNKVAVS